MQPPAQRNIDTQTSPKEKYITGSKEGVIQLQPKNWVHDVKVIPSSKDDKKENTQKPSPPT